MDSATFSTWFTPITFEGVRQRELIIRVPSHFFYDYIEEHFIGILRAAVRREFGEGIRIAYKIETDSTHNITQRAEDDPSAAAAREPLQQSSPAFGSGSAAVQPAAEMPSHLQPELTFNTFVEGDANKLARSIGMSIADNPGQMTFNPLFIYGPSGVGKTHLLNAIGLRVKEKSPLKRVLYVSAHLFLVQYADATRQNRRNEFIHYYQGVEVLIIDDIQELAGESKRKTQEAFFHIFNHLQRTSHQLVLASDRPPVELEGVEDRLLTRFKWGLVAELRRPDAAMTKRILLSKMKRCSLSFAPEVVDYIARSSSGNVRELEGVVNSLLAYSVVYNVDVDLAAAERIVGRTGCGAGGELTAERIIMEVGRHYGLAPEEICSRSRRRDVLRARQVAMYLCQRLTPLSLEGIGRAVGGRDHSTVVHSCNVVKQLARCSEEFRDEMNEIQRQL